MVIGLVVLFGALDLWVLFYLEIWGVLVECRCFGFVLSLILGFVLVIVVYIVFVVLRVWFIVVWYWCYDLFLLGLIVL